MMYVLCFFSCFGGIADFMAPEMVTGKERQSTGMDWWALGVMLFEITLGTLPFHSELPFQSNNEVFRSIVNAELKFPRHHKLSRSAVDFIRHLLRKARRGRGVGEREGRDGNGEERRGSIDANIFFFSQNQLHTKTIDNPQTKNPNPKYSPPKSHTARDSLTKMLIRTMDATYNTYSWMFDFSFSLAFESSVSFFRPHTPPYVTISATGMRSTSTFLCSIRFRRFTR